MKRSIFSFLLVLLVGGLYCDSSDSNDKNESGSLGTTWGITCQTGSLTGGEMTLQFVQKEDLGNGVIIELYTGTATLDSENYLLQVMYNDNESVDNIGIFIYKSTDDLDYDWISFDGTRVGNTITGTYTGYGTYASSITAGDFEATIQ